MNYYIDEAEFEIMEKNIYTAIEIVTAMPLRGKNAFDNFITGNSWVNEFFAQYDLDTIGCKKNRGKILKSAIELLFDNKMGNWLDNVLMKITAKRWRKKTEQKKRNSSGILLGMDAGKHYSKPLPGHLQEKVLLRFNLKMEQLLTELESIPSASAV
jgi:hypothetical protein